MAQGRPASDQLHFYTLKGAAIEQCIGLGVHDVCMMFLH
jgi:hypothetical protein